MTKTLTRISLTLTTIMAGVICGNAWAPAVILATAWILASLADYGMRVTEQALTGASLRRIAELTWQLRTDAAHLALQQRRLMDQRDRWLQWHPYTPVPAWPTVDLDRVDANLYTPPGGLPLLCGYAA